MSAMHMTHSVSVTHLEPLVQVTYEGDTHRQSLAIKHSRIDGPHAELSSLGQMYKDDQIVYAQMADWLRDRFSSVRNGIKNSD